VIQLLASSVQKTERAQAALGSACVALLDAGGHDSINPKHWPCEDSLAVCEVPGGLLALVADSHWGGGASEAAATGLARAWERAKAPHLKGRLAKTLLLLEARFSMAKSQSDRSETTVLIAHVTSERVDWVNVGDSFLWVIGSEGAELLNQRTMHFMGRVPLAVSSALSSGSRPLAGSERLLVASDGIEPQASGLQEAEVASFLVGQDLGAELEALGTRACDAAQGGGRDNLALIYLDPSRLETR
jgi:serine/threonine protein phosphatase PrpC